MAPFDFERSKTIIASNKGPLGSVLVAVAVGASFGAGALVGGGGAQATEASQRDDNVLARAERRATELDEKRDALKLSFASDLVRADAKLKPPPLPRGKAAPATEPAPAHVTAPVEPEVAAIIDKAAAAAAQDDHGDDDEPLVPKKSDPARVQQALAKVLGTPAPAPRVESSDKTFALQVASVPSKDGAETLKQKLAGQGHAARVVEADLEDGRKVFRVRVGGFTSRDQADAYKARLGMPAFVISE